MEIICNQRGCKSTVEGDTAPALCPVCKNPLIGYQSATAAGNAPETASGPVPLAAENAPETASGPVPLVGKSE